MSDLLPIIATKTLSPPAPLLITHNPHKDPLASGSPPRLRGWVGGGVLFILLPTHCETAASPE